MKSNDEYSLQLQINGIYLPYLSATLRASNAWQQNAKVFKHKCKAKNPLWIHIVSISVISFYFIPQDFWQGSSNSVNQLLRSRKGQTTTPGTPGIPCPTVSISVAFVKLSQRNKNLLLILFALYVINRYFQSHVTLLQKQTFFDNKDSFSCQQRSRSQPAKSSVASWKGKPWCPRATHKRFIKGNS